MKIKNPSRLAIVGLIAIFFVLSNSVAAQRANNATSLQSSRSSATETISGSVTDQNGDAVAGARVVIQPVRSGGVVNTMTSDDGKFTFGSLSAGRYRLRVSAPGFEPEERVIDVPASGLSGIDVELSVGSGRFTVTAEVGQSEDRRNVPQPVNVIDTQSILERSTSVLAQAGEEEAGLNVQRTSPTIGAIVVRGLTGKNVVNFVDGVRYTNGAQRGGINTFLNLNEQSALESIEVLRGPNSAQYGSDSLAGTVNLVTRSPAFSADKTEFHGEFTPAFATADRSFGSSALLSFGIKKFAGYVNLAGRRFGNLRTADGLDSHSAITRFLGLPSTVLYDRNPDTGFKQYSGATKLSYAPTGTQQLTFFYERSQQDDGKRFDQLLGGDGNLIADLRNLMLNLAYLRYLKQKVGPFDSASITASYNSQREERVNQGGQGNPFGDITHQYERTSTFGLSGFLDKQIGTNTLLFGGDYYRERVNSPSYIQNPSTGAVRLARPRIPDEARFDSAGVFVQDQWNAIPDRLRITGALRFSGMKYRVRAADSPLVNGNPLWSDDELSTNGFSGRIGAVVRATENLRFAFSYGRGFRYPNITDLGTLGLTGDGFEVDHLTAGALGGQIGTTAGADAVSTGLPVAKQESEFSNNFDFSVRYQQKRFDAEFTVFRLDIVNAITKQALILPPGSVGHSLGGQTITNQLPSGVVFVAASTAPVLVRSNFTSAKTWGIEYENEARLHRDLLLRANFTFIHAEDSDTGLPPSIEGGTPPPTGFVSIRYNRRRFWIEPYFTFAAKQDRLSSLDLSDRRTGAARSRAQIQNFFRRGACVRGLTTPGSTGVCGSAGGILTSTGETQAQVQNRLLPIGAVINGVTVVNDNTAVPLFTYLPGYGLANIRGGININENTTVFVAFENIFDQFYRNPSWGIDGPGRSFTGQLRIRF